MGNLLDMLSPREKQVALLILQGKSNKEICTELGIVIQTSKYHIAKLYKKAGVKTRCQFIVQVLPETLSSNNSGPSSDS